MANPIAAYRWFFLILILLLPSTMAESDSYIIHMDTSAMPKAFSSPHSWYLATLASVLDSSSAGSKNTLASSKLIYSYKNAMHGFSASLSSSEYKAMKNSPGYVSSSEDMTVKLHTTHSSHFLGLNSMSGSWPKSNYGKYVIIGVVDTGVWPESRSFDDDGMTQVPSRWKGICQTGTQFNSSLCNKKLIGARYFNKGLLAKVKNLTITRNSARDTEGHGTHTSSTAAGSLVKGASYFGYAPGFAIGVAPMAHVAVYKALWDGAGTISDILAALDQAIADGCDVLSLSFGAVSPFPLYIDPIAIASFSAMEKGIFVSVSAGNSGPFDQSLSNEAPWFLSVAASTVDRDVIRILTLGNGVSVTGLSLYPGNSTNDISIILVKNCLDEQELQNVTDKFVVCIDKNSLVGKQVENVRHSNAAGAIFITNDFVTDLGEYLKTEFPSVFLNFQDGDQVLKYVNNTSSPKAKIGLQGTLIGVGRAPAVAHFSSRGPSTTCPFILKPDLMAPGHLILASWSPLSSVSLYTELHNIFNIISGTSMSCPHAAGVAALVKGAHPEWSPAAIRSAMMTTADVLDNTQNPIQDIGRPENAAATPLAMGAGHINPNKAIDPGLIYDTTPQDYINLLCALNLTSKQIKTITRSSYTCPNPSLDLNYPSFIAYFNVNSSELDPTRIQEFKRTVTNVGERVSEYTAELTAMPGLKVSIVPEKLVFKDKYEKQSYKLRIECPKLMNDFLVHGSLRWMEKGGKYVVRSPIVATNSKV
ncbi:subtilisin-like protease SBT3 [Nicotiana sylvestris]|uniref:Subtilisin-like protease n=1 Tax=Nicotiana sylvestris TaxID=4096 RepID=A0A1U7Y545_NICSY|nr:PREDICTED: subtilisin-like protease [Nicotiana sylvestris]